MALQIRACAVLFFAAAALLAHDPHDPIQVVAISPNFAHDQTLLAASTGMTVKLGSILLFKSTDGGANWSPLPGLPGNSNIYSVAFSPAYAKDKTVLVAGDAGLYRSTDNATTWATLSTESFIDMALSPNFAKDNTLYVLTNNRKIFRSTNRGQKLGSISAPASLTGALSTLAVSPNLATDHTLLLGTQKNGIFKSTNGGGSWTPVTTGTVPKIEALEYSPSFSSDQTVFAATLGSGFLISTNAGQFLDAIELRTHGYERNLHGVLSGLCAGCHSVGHHCCRRCVPVGQSRRILGPSRYHPAHPIAAHDHSLSNHRGCPRTPTAGHLRRAVDLRQQRGILGLHRSESYAHGPLYSSIA